jgi:hypothetical protein
VGCGRSDVNILKHFLFRTIGGNCELLERPIDAKTLGKRA